MNLYDLINEELKRMTIERDEWFDMARCLPKVRSTYGEAEHPDVKVFDGKYYELEHRINQVRDLIFAQFENYDKKIQEKIAELALTGDADGK